MQEPGRYSALLNVLRRCIGTDHLLLALLHEDEQAHAVGVDAATAAEKARTISSRHLLLALLEREEPDSAATLFAALSVDRQAVRNSLIAA